MPPMWTRRRRILVPSSGALLLGGTGLLLGPVWAAAGVVLGPFAAIVCYGILLTFITPDPDELLQAGRPEDALVRISQLMRTYRLLAEKWPSQFRDVLAHYLVTKSQALQALDREPQALDAVAEAVAIYADFAAARPGKVDAGLAYACYQQSGLLGVLSRHGEALGAVEVAVRLYRNLAVADRGRYLPCLAESLDRQADELGYLDRIDEARAATAEAALIRSDMLPAIAQP